MKNESNQHSMKGKDLFQNKVGFQAFCIEFPFSAVKVL